MIEDLFFINTLFIIDLQFHDWWPYKPSKCTLYMIYKKQKRAQWLTREENEKITSTFADKYFVLLWHAYKSKFNGG